MEKGKSQNALMKHIRDEHRIEIGGSVHKRMIQEMGYYHGYKAYRFLKNVKNKAHHNNFSQIVSTYNYDNRLKQILYPYVMRLETILKNIVIDELVSSEGVTFDKIYEQKLTRYREMSSSDKNYSQEMKRRLELKRNFDAAVSNAYGKNPIVEHFVNASKALPIWAEFELITLGTFGNFVGRLNTDIKLNIAKKIGTYNKSNDTSGMMLERHIFILKELRNSIAHNGIIFDTRFQKSRIDKSVKKQLANEFQLSDVAFSTIVDYLLLVLHYFKAVGVTKTELKQLIRDFESATQDFENTLSDTGIFFGIVGSDYLLKLQAMRDFINRK
ncbi:MAG: Abi family protein [Streptococcaceae bacterium]|jgi:abortive infection bacteriophage resistance protein|nr:Abi family protein [Streptococcaceae bacterium]